MAKYDFNNSTFSKLWDSVEGPRLLSAILTNPEMIRAYPTFWKQHFGIDPNITPTNADGTATFVSRVRELNDAYLMDMRAPLGDSIPEDKKGVSFYTGVIPDFIARGTVEQAMEREYKEQLFVENFGNDAQIVAQFVDDVQTKINAADMTLSNMAAQLMSKGFINYQAGLGIKGGILKAEIPAENFVKAGEKAWSDPEAQILTQMAQIEEEARERFGEIAMQWNIPYKMFHNVILKNKQVAELVQSYRTLNEKPIVSGMGITEEMFREAIVAFEGISPIVIVQEKQRDVVGMVSGWSENVAVLRPVGLAGLIRHTTILDQKMYEKYGATTIARAFAKTGNGLFTVMNTTLNNGNMKEWHTDLMMSAVPSLDEFPYHVIVDTSSANA